MPRVKGAAPGYPRYFSSFQSSGRSAWVYKRRTGTPEIVVKRACPCSSRFMPVAAPIGFSGAFSIVGASVSSAHFFSAEEGWRFTKRSAMGVSAIVGGLGDFLSGMNTPVFCLMIGKPAPAGKAKGCDQNDRSVNDCRLRPACGKVPMLSHISMRHIPHGKDA